jgi:iron-sulfur cluster assembly accessory protein
MQITVTDKAIKQLLANGLSEDNFLRLVIQPGGCAGMSYDAYIDSGLTNRDEVIFKQDDVCIVAEALFLQMLDGLIIDFSDDLIQPGFILKNPNAVQSCGCGASFKADDMDPPCTTCGGCG